MEKRRLVSDTSPIRIETLIEDAAGRIPNHPALIFGARCWTYGQLRAEMDRRAALLIEHGLQPGDVVAVVAAVSDHVVLAALACCRAGLASCYLSPASTPAEGIAIATRAGGHDPARRCRPDLIWRAATRAVFSSFSFPFPFHRWTELTQSINLGMREKE